MLQCSDILPDIDISFHWLQIHLINKAILAAKPGSPLHRLPMLAGPSMDRGECGNDRPGFGVQPVSQKLVANNYKRLLELLEVLRR